MALGKHDQDHQNYLEGNHHGSHFLVVSYGIQSHVNLLGPSSCWDRWLCRYSLRPSLRPPPHVPSVIQSGELQ